MNGRLPASAERSRRTIEQHRTASDEVPASEQRLNTVLAGQKPIHRRVVFVGMHPFDVELRLERSVLPPARCGESGGRMIPAAIMIQAGLRSRLGRAASSASNPSLRSAMDTASTAPWEQERSTSKAARAST